MHRRVKGIAPDGRPYSADDPELVTFIHVAEVASFLASSQRYGSRPLTPEECDRYYEEVAPVALALGATWAPRSVRGGRELFPPPAARALRRARRPRPPATGCCAAWLGDRASGPSTRWSWRPRSASSRAGPARELGLSIAGPLDLLVDTAAVTPLIRGLSTALRWMVTPPG